MLRKRKVVRDGYVSVVVCILPHFCSQKGCGGGGGEGNGCVTSIYFHLTPKFLNFSFQKSPLSH